MEAMVELKNKCLSCRECPLCEHRTQVVFGTGNPDSPVMFIGEGPGEQEDLQGVPFVGPAGKLLDDMLEMIDLDRSKVYIANIVKCRPPRNRDPLGEEQNSCRHWLRSQMELIEPRIIVCLGRIAATALIDEGFRITKDHGRWYDMGECRAMAIYHPSALLRDISKRPETFADLRAIRAEIRRLCPEVYS